MKTQSASGAPELEAATYFRRQHSTNYSITSSQRQTFTSCPPTKIPHTQSRRMLNTVYVR